MADWTYVAPWNTGLTDDPTQEQIIPTEYGFINPFEGMSMLPTTQPTTPQPPPSFQLPSGNEALNWASILGGLGLGLASPRIAPQALQNLQAMSTIKWREDQKKFAQERLDLARRNEAMQRRTFQEMQRRRVGDEAPPTVAGPAPVPPPPAAPEVSAAPPLPGSPTAPTPVTPSSQVAEQPPAPFFTEPAAPIRRNLSEGLSAYGVTQTESTNYGPAKEQATQHAITDLSNAMRRNMRGVQQDPKRLFDEVMSRNRGADAEKVRHTLTTDFYNAHLVQGLQQGIDPKTAAQNAFLNASQDLGPGIFAATDKMNEQVLQVPSIEEQRALAAIRSNQGKLRQLNVIESNSAAALQGAKNAADIFTKAIGPAAAQLYEQPPPASATLSQLEGRRIIPMSKEREVGIVKREQERSDRQVKIETVAPVLSSIMGKAEEVRKGLLQSNRENLFKRFAQGADIAQSEITGFPTTELGRLIHSYDTFVQTNGSLMAKSYQAQVGNLTEQEAAIGKQGYPRTYKELWNNPVASNDRIAVIGDAISLDLRDPSFHLDRLDVPMSEFEKGVEARRHARIQSRPELYGNIPLIPGQMRSAPPTIPPTILTPDEQAIKDRVNQEIQDYLKQRTP